MTIPTIPNWLAIVSILLNAYLVYRAIGVRKLLKFYRGRWAYFEAKYYSLYAAYIKSLPPDKLARIQDITLNKDKESWQLDEPLTKPI